ncbi:MAG: hypothetical protein DMF49_00575 [Acidobacteria bacterium]|nr:MAG: hypothetical protein DMF49_00575 [Acidobacteriota bacterium]
MKLLLREAVRVALIAFGAALLIAPAGSGSGEPQQKDEQRKDPPRVRKSVKVFGPYDLEAGGLMQVPGGRVPMTFPDRSWVLSYSTEVVDPEGRPLQNDLHCHTILWTWFTEEWRNRGFDGVPFRGLLSDGYTTGFRVPEGFGIFCDKDEPLSLLLAFNNRTPGVVRASYRVTVEYVLDSELTHPLTPLYGTLESVVTPHLYMVKPGTDVRERKFSFPYDGTIHAMAVHIHPYGKSIEMINDSRGETVWKAVGKKNGSGVLENMPFYVDAKGYSFRADETYRLRVTYENPTDKEQDAMAGVIVLFSTKDGKMPRPTTPPPAGGVEDSQDLHTHHHGG